MNTSEAVTNTALSAFFELCVPAVSGGAFQQSFPPEKIVRLTSEETQRYGADSKEDEELWRVVCDDGFILLSIQQPYCRIMTGDDDPRAAKQKFLNHLSSVGFVKPTEPSAPGTESIMAFIPVAKNENVAVTFTIRLEPEAQGFYASAFRVMG